MNTPEPTYMPLDEATRIFRDLGIEPTPEEASYAILDFRKARLSFTKEEYSEEEHQARMNAAFSIMHFVKDIPREDQKPAGPSL